MRWFDDSSDLPDEEWNRLMADYALHLDRIDPLVPANVLALARDPKLELKDARFREVRLDLGAETVVLILEGPNLQGGYRQLDLRFDGASIIPDNLQRLGYAVSAEFRATERLPWRSTTVIRYQEIDLAENGRFVLRLRLWPFHEFAVHFTALSIVETPADRFRRGRGGNFVIIHPPGSPWA